MNLTLIYSVLLTLVPGIELRGGLPLAIVYASENEIPILLVSVMIILINILLVFFVFWFLDNLHGTLMKNTYYKKLFENYLKRFQKRVDKFERKHSAIGFLALILFVAVPIPGTGAWSGGLVSWILGLERKKSILSIALGVSIAGILILFATLGVIGLLS